MKHSVTYLFVLMLMLACKPTVPSEYIQPGEMEDILYDYHIAQAMSRTSVGSEADLNKQVYLDAVLKKYGISEADFDSSLVYYYSRADRFKEIYSHVSERLNDEAKALVDTTFHLGDSFMFQFMSEFLYQTGSKDAVVCVLTKYEGDSIIQTANHVSIAGLSQIRVPANRDKKLKEMSGYIYLSDGGDLSDTRKLMYVSQMQLIRFHDKSINKTDGTNKKDSVQTDSLQRIDNPGRAVPDTLRRRIVGRRPLNLRKCNDGVVRLFDKDKPIT